MVRQYSRPPASIASSAGSTTTSRVCHSGQLRPGIKRGGNCITSRPASGFSGNGTPM